MSVQVRGSGGSIAGVDANGNVQVVLPDATTPEKVGGVRNFSENDTGAGLGTNVPTLVSPEADSDYRLRVSQDWLVENETFNYLAQNTGKYQYHNTTITNAWTTSGMNTNSGLATTTTTGTSFRSYAVFPTFGTCTTAADMELSFSNWLVQNTIIDFGLGLNATTNPYAPTDGVYFRATSAGLVGVSNFNGVETTVNLAFTPIVNQKYQFIVYLHHRKVQFWINNGTSTDLYGVINTPAGQGQPSASPSVPLFIRHAIVGGAASAAMSATLSNWCVRVGGIQVGRDVGDLSNSLYGSYQGLSGGTMGSLSTYTNSTNATAAAPSNTALTANLVAGLGGQAWETFTTGLALNTDGLILSYQVPAVGVNAQGRRLKINGVKLSAFVQTVLVGGGFNSTFTLNFGHTAVSLATAEAATTKARRVVLLPELTQTVAVTQAANTAVSQFSPVATFANPIYVNPSEFVSIAVKHIGTAATSGVIAYNIQLDYSWE
jgi:hypothetical protein